MRRTIRRVGVIVAAFVLVTVAVLVVNQTAQVVLLADRVHPLLGTGVLWGLVAVYALCVAVPILLLMRLPSPLLPPDTSDAKESQKYRAQLRKRLQGHPALRDQPLRDDAELETALRVLDARAEEVIRRTSSQVFLSTAVSQYGNLSSLLVLTAQVKMVWEVAHVYHQRPPLRQVMSLYANVASTAFVAGHIEDIDVAEQVEPVVSSVLGSVAGAIPGLQVASDLFVNSVFIGSANAFLTLRVGVITKRYCGSVARPERKGLRTSATAESVGMLRHVVAAGAKKISGAFVTASGRAIGGAAKGIGGAVRGAGSSMARKIRFGGSDTPDEGSESESVMTPEES